MVCWEHWDFDPLEFLVDNPPYKLIWNPEFIRVLVYSELKCGQANNYEKIICQQMIDDVNKSDLH